MTSFLYKQQGGEGWKKDKLGLPPVWVEKVEAIEEDISRIQLKSKSYFYPFENLYRRLLIVTYTF